MKKPSKKLLVLDYLHQHKRITAWQAIQMFKATRLADIIFNLRAEGWHIDTHNRVSPDGTRYAEYELIAEQSQLF
jgi:hypothetical protein